MGWRGLILACVAGSLASLPAAAETTTDPLPGPNIVIITVDTLRYDRLSANGYRRPTSPSIDALLARGARFTETRVPEPLTAPAMISMVTSLHPHEHGATRNGLRMRPGLASLATILAVRGYETAAFVGNWTLKDQISGLGEHFGLYNEVFNRKRWFGLWFSEATAEDLTRESLAWMADHLSRSRRPFLVWVHYVEPHAPYRFHREFASDLGIRSGGDVTPSDRYDTEIAFVDRSIGALIAGFDKLARAIDPIIVFTADHGESLGEHGYWGHGRNLYDPNLRVPFGMIWEGEIEPATIEAPASILDVAPTLLSLAGATPPSALRGFDWSGVLRGEGEPPIGRVTQHQAHKGAVQGRSVNARRQGLLSVARIANGRKEVFRVKNDRHRLFDLSRDAAELENLVAEQTSASEALAEWLREVREGLIASDELPPPSLDEASLEQLRALGYID